MMPEEKIGVPSEETLALEKFISEKADGEFITYKEVKELFKIDLRTSKGRGKFYSAGKRLGREFLNVQNYGYKLSSPATAMTITNGKVERIGSAAKRTVNAIGNLRNHHESEMPEPQLSAMTHIEHSCNAILGTKRSMKRIIRKELPKLSEINPKI